MVGQVALWETLNRYVLQRGQWVKLPRMATNPSLCSTCGTRVYDADLNIIGRMLVGGVYCTKHLDLDAIEQAFGGIKKSDA